MILHGEEVDDEHVVTKNYGRGEVLDHWRKIQEHLVVITHL